MRKKRILPSLLGVVSVAVFGWGLTAGSAMAAHPEVPLYTYEEIGMQFTPNFDPNIAPVAVPGTDFNMMPVMVNAQGKGFPYSPKMTCGNCHNGTTSRWDGAGNVDADDPTRQLASYDDLTDHAFHSELGAEEWQHDDDNAPVTSQPGKPWSSTNGMWGKW